VGYVPIHGKTPVHTRFAKLPRGPGGTAVAVSVVASITPRSESAGHVAFFSSLRVANTITLLFYIPRFIYIYICKYTTRIMCAVRMILLLPVCTLPRNRARRRMHTPP